MDREAPAFYLILDEPNYEKILFGLPSFREERLYKYNVYKYQQRPNLNPENIPREKKTSLYKVSPRHLELWIEDSFVRIFDQPAFDSLGFAWSRAKCDNIPFWAASILSCSLVGNASVDPLLFFFFTPGWRFLRENYTAAIDEYSNGIKLKPQNVTLFANRAEAYLRLFQFHNALNDAEVVLKYDPSHLKAAYRKGKALCGLKRYKEAIITLQNLYQSIKSNTDDSISSIKQSIEQLLKHAEIFDSENENGQYDYISIIDECCERAKIRKDSKGNDEWVYEIGARLDHADFLCEDIEIRLVEGKGRGWIAKRDIPENTLLIVSKAFSIVYSHEVLGYSMKSNIQNDQTLSLCSVELIHRITQKLLEEPYHRQEVYKLYNGLNLDKPNMNLANVDIIGNIVGLNSFELNNIIVGNSSLSGEGLWILPSYFNHTCIDENVTQYILGDLMFIRSLRPILQGEELLVNYRSSESNNEIRLMLLKSMGIDCQCRLCKLDKSETPETTHK
ncbi:hypothetical protein RhiirA4_498461 [Rhizophagus irregularis]|uniref:SET domain-containing protein n=1 Tax=Rhizophagus irregularis TaxID=588596 RepID=A0A2I1H2S5_9GLOM|nr:hypothetical protein RhiirA4_498461 [Rhizophagus irregularis]